MFPAAELLAERPGVSRSELNAGALAAVIEKHRSDIETARPDAAYGAEEAESALDPLLSAMQARSLGRYRT